MRSMEIRCDKCNGIMSRLWIDKFEEKEDVRAFFTTLLQTYHA